MTHQVISQKSKRVMGIMSAMEINLGGIEKWSWDRDLDSGFRKQSQYLRRRSREYKTRTEREAMKDGCVGNQSSISLGTFNVKGIRAHWPILFWRTKSSKSQAISFPLTMVWGVFYQLQVNSPWLKVAQCIHIVMSYPWNSYKNQFSCYVLTIFQVSSIMRDTTKM